MHQSAAFTAGQPWMVFSAAPHRLMFFAGAVQLVLTPVILGGGVAGSLYRPMVAPANYYSTSLGSWISDAVRIVSFFIFGF